MVGPPDHRGRRGRGRARRSGRGARVRAHHLRAQAHELPQPHRRDGARDPGHHRTCRRSRQQVRDHEPHLDRDHRPRLPGRGRISASGRTVSSRTCTRRPRTSTRRSRADRSRRTSTHRRIGHTGVEEDLEREQRALARPPHPLDERAAAAAGRGGRPARSSTSRSRRSTSSTTTSWCGSRSRSTGYPVRVGWPWVPAIVVLFGIGLVVALTPRWWRVLAVLLAMLVLSDMAHAIGFEIPRPGSNVFEDGAVLRRQLRLDRGLDRGGTDDHRVACDAAWRRCTAWSSSRCSSRSSGARPTSPRSGSRSCPMRGRPGSRASRSCRARSRRRSRRRRAGAHDPQPGRDRARRRRGAVAFAARLRALRRRAGAHRGRARRRRRARGRTPRARDAGRAGCAPRSRRAR